jgi:hypothetical protein
MIQAGWDENWAEGDDFKVSLGITLIPFFNRGR